MASIWTRVTRERKVGVSSCGLGRPRSPGSWGTAPRPPAGAAPRPPPVPPPPNPPPPTPPPPPPPRWASTTMMDAARSAHTASACDRVERESDVRDGDVRNIRDPWCAAHVTSATGAGPGIAALYSTVGTIGRETAGKVVYPDREGVAAGSRGPGLPD